MPGCISRLDDRHWSSEIGFLPFVGPSYEHGITEIRVLLLGESHYIEQGIDNSPEVTRPYTRKIFNDRIEPKRQAGDGRYFPPLDRLLTGKVDPSPQDAASIWRRVAFSNLVQEFVGTKGGDRPEGTQFCDGSRILVEHVLPVLRPDVVLVLGRETWRGLDAGAVLRELQPYCAEEVRARHQKSREIWALPYRGGEALMTWTYHPSRSIDTSADLAGALQYLLTLRRNEQR
jgi:hypothetical protein